MGVGRSYSVALLGLNGYIVEVEADIGQTLPNFVILGLPDAALNEAKERIRSAAQNSGIPLSRRKITANLIPASLPKRGSGFDLANAKLRHITSCQERLKAMELNAITAAESLTFEAGAELSNVVSILERRTANQAPEGWTVWPDAVDGTDIGLRRGPSFETDGPIGAMEVTHSVVDGFRINIDTRELTFVEARRLHAALGALLEDSKNYVGGKADVQ